jgi:dTDP-4-dehydrorhamnose reductase
LQKVLILGASGLVGKALIDEFKDGFDLYGTYSSSFTSLSNDKQYKLDVQQIDELKEMIRSIKPDLVISCLRGEFDQQYTFHKELALELAHNNSRMYYFSTTNVFDGDFSRPHFETDIPISESDYGKFKTECENMLKEILNERVMIVRIPAIWGKNSPRWNTIKDRIENNKEIDGYSNLVCNNLLDVSLAKQLRFIIEKELKGIFHLGSVDLMTQGKFYEQILSELGSEKSLLRDRLYQDNDATYYFQLSSNRDDLAGAQQYTNDEIISFLLGNYSTNE